MIPKKYPNWDYNYRDFINQYKPDIVIDRTSVAKVNDKEVIDTITEINDEGEEIVIDTKYARTYYIVDPTEKFSAYGESKTLTDWKWESEEEGIPANNYYIPIEHWFIVDNNVNSFSYHFADYYGYFRTIWWESEKEPTFNLDFRFVLVVSVGPLPGRKIDTNIIPSSRMGAKKGVLEGIMQSTFSDSGYEMEAGSLGTIGYDGKSQYFINYDSRNNIADPSYVKDPNGLDMPNIDDNQFEYSKFSALPYPTIISGMKATFPGYEYAGVDPEIHFDRIEIWPGANNLPDLNFSSQVGEQINRNIATAEDLANMQYGYGMTFVLTKDIFINELPNIKNFWNTVIDSQDLYYDYYDWDYISVNLYGNNHKIICEGKGVSKGGLFSLFGGGLIRDIVFEDFEVVKEGNVGLIIDKVNYSESDSMIDNEPTRLINIEANNCIVECIKSYQENISVHTSASAGGLIGTINTISWGEY